MPEVYYQHPDTWFGDCMPFFHDGEFYLFHQRDTRRPEPFGEPFGWALATTRDFVHFEDLGEVIPRGGDDDQDQFIFAGSVFEANGTFYAMYTGYNRDYPAQGKASQVMMLATSDDLVHWTKTGKHIVPPQRGYDPYDWRDPYVLWDDAGQRFIMILGARHLDGEKILTGATVWFTSTDLENWEFQGDFWAPGLYTMHEMPDLFKIGDWWYLLTTEYSDRSKTVYRMSRSLEGPWQVPIDDAFDGRAYYAARSVSDGERRYLVGWVATRENNDDQLPWQWGGTLVVHEVFQRADGSLGVRIPGGVTEALSASTVIETPGFELERGDGLAERYLAEELPAQALFSTTFTVGEGTRSVALRFLDDPATGDGYEFQLLAGERRIVFARRPNYPWHRNDNRGLERPFDFSPGTEHNLQLVLDDDLVTIYVDDVALNSRACSPTGKALAVQVVDGSVSFGPSRLSTLA